MDRRAIERFKKNRAAVAGAAIVTFLALFALFAPLVVPHDPLASDFVNGRTDDGTPAPPSLVHPLGTDQLFRDELARLAHGARLSLEIGIMASMISLFIGAAAASTRRRKMRATISSPSDRGRRAALRRAG